MAKKQNTKPSNTDQAAEAATAEEGTGLEDEIVNPKQSARDSVLAGIDEHRKQQLEEDGATPPAEAEAEDEEEKTGDEGEGEGEDEGKAGKKAKTKAPAKPADAGKEKDEQADQDEEETDRAAADAGDADDAGEAEGEEAEPDKKKSAEPLYTVIVDGEERQVTLAELQKSYQLEEAARSRLQQANEILDQAEAVRRNVTQAPVDQGQGQAPPAGGQPAPVQPPTSDFDGEDAASKLQYGSKEEAGIALRDAAAAIAATYQGSAQALTPEQVEMRVLDRVEWNQAAARFGDEFKDIANDKTGWMQKLAAGRAEELFHYAVQTSIRTGRPARPNYWAIFRQAGEDVRNFIDEVRGSADEGDPKNRPEPNRKQTAQTKVQLDPGRTEAKRNAIPSPSPRAVQPATAGAPPKPKSPEQVQRDGIKEILQSRAGRHA